MKKVMLLTALLFLISGCNANQMLMYDGVERQQHEIEEIIENQLELQNPTMDLEVTIINELQ